MKKMKFIVMLSCLAGIIGEGNLAIAKDLYVSPSGDDNISYDANNINNPWRSVSKGFTSAAPGDKVYFRGGNYTITSTIETKYAQNGTASNPIIFSNYNGENVTLTSTVNRAIKIDRNYYHISGVTYTAPGTFWMVGWSNSANYFKLSNSVGTVSVPGGGDNYGCVRFNSTLANYGIVENCVFYGPGAGENINTAGVYAFRTQGIKILNNAFYNIPRAIYYKHTCIASDTGIEYAYNYFENNGYGVVSVAQYADIHGNLFVNGGMLLGTDGGVGDDGSNAGSDHNQIYYNTFYNSPLELIRSSSNDGSGAQYNTIRDNLFTMTSRIFQYESLPHYSIMNNNLYVTGTAVVNNRVNYSLSDWQGSYGEDEDSLSGSAEFVGGDYPAAITDFILTTSSPGYKSSSDGKDIGADVTLVGPNAHGGGGAPLDEKPGPVIDFKMETNGLPQTNLANECLNYSNLHPGWIFCDDFESETPLVGDGRYFEYKDDDGDFIPLANIGVDGSRGMQVLWQAGEYDAGSLALGFGRNPSSYMDKNIHSGEDFREIYYRMYLKNEAGWEGSPYKLSRTSVVSSSDWSQAMIAHLWASNTGDNTLAMDPVSCVVNGVVQCSGWNDFNSLKWLGKKTGIDPIFSTEQAGQWKCVEVHVKLNDPGQNNGIHEFWIDGELQARSADLNFTDTYTEYGLNYLAFENYWNNGSIKDQKRYFDNIVVSTVPIGCQ